MPSVSKKQQKFMGIVRSIQKGDEPASKFSKDAQDAAKKMKKSSVKKYAKTDHDDLPTKKEGVQKDRNNLAMYIIDLNNMLRQAKLSKNSKAKSYIKIIQKDLKDAKNKLSKLKEERDYKDEYKKFQSSTKSKKYRAELNKYNRKKGTYGNGDNKDASHKGGKIVGFESQSKNRGRAEKSRLKKESSTEYGKSLDKIAKDKKLKMISKKDRETLIKISKLLRKENDIPNFTPIIDEAIDGLITEGVRDPGIFKAIFLAGGPGSGKSYVAQNLFGIPEKVNVSKTGLKMVNQDAELELLLKKYFGTTDIDNMPDELFADLTGVDKAGQDVDYETSGLRKYAKSLSKERLRLYTEGKLGVIIDGTGHNFNKLKTRRKKLIDLGYDTFMVFVNTSLDVALQRNLKRDRVVPEEIVKDSWQDVQNNMGAFQGLFGGSNFMIVQNNKHLSKAQSHKHFKMLVEKGIDSFLKKPIKSKIGKAWVKREKKNQKVFKDPGQSKFFESKSYTKERILMKDPKVSVGNTFSKIIDKLPNSKLTKDLVIKLAKKYKIDQEVALKFVSYSHLRDFGLKENIDIDCLCEACWKGYEKKGMKTMFGKRYPNCVKKTKKKEGVNEGTCGYGMDGELGEEPAGPHLLKKKKMKEATEMSKGVQKLIKIADSGYGKVGGTTVDGMSANLFKQVYNKANDDIKKKLNTKNEKQLVRILGGMWKKFGKNVTIGSSV